VTAGLFAYPSTPSLDKHAVLRYTFDHILILVNRPGMHGEPGGARLRGEPAALDPRT
jgi:hypothetical protein